MNNKCQKHNEIKVKHGRHLKCRSCNREYQRIWYLKNQYLQNKRTRENDKKAKNRARKFILKFLRKHPCIDCGITDVRVLTFDHRDPSKKEYTISTMFSWGVNTIKREIKKCDVRCANCHLIRTSKQFDTWRSRIHEFE